MVSCALVALSNKFNKKELSSAKQYLKSRGIDVLFSPVIKNYFDKWAGNPEYRLNQINTAFSLDVDYISALKGGTGVLHFVSKVNFSILKTNPKFFIGYSDLTPLLNLIYERTGIVSLHGPNALKSLDEASIECMNEALQAKSYSLAFRDCINPSKKPIKGVIKGGNLSLCAWSLGTSTEIDLKNKIVFLEDVDINFRDFYNLLVQLKDSKNFKPLALLIGYVDVVDNGLVKDMLKNLFPSIPIVFGLKAGHQLPNYTIPIGSNCSIDFDRGLVTFKFPDSAKGYAVNFV